MDIPVDALDEAYVLDAYSYACASCRFRTYDKDTGVWDCFCCLDPCSSRCPFSSEVEVRLSDCFERFGQDLEESMRGATL